MTDDLVAKLRRNAAESEECEICPVLMEDAADRIEQLERELAEAVQEIEQWQATAWRALGVSEKAVAEIKRHCAPQSGAEHDRS